MKAVFFDLDETILDRTRSLKEFVFWQARGMLRNSISDEEAFCQRFIELDSNGKVWKDKVYKKLIDEFNITDWSASELLQSYELCFSGFSKLKPQSLEALQCLNNKGYQPGLVSNGKSPFQERNFNALGVSDLFNVVIISEAVGYRKPEKEIFELACKRLNVLPEEVVFVGDNPEADIDGANRFGMYTVFIPGYFGQTYGNANITCHTYSDLVSIVDNAI